MYMHIGIEHIPTCTHTNQVTGEPQTHTHRHTCMYTDLSVKQCDCLYLEVVMSVMSFLHAPENNLAIWILSITLCLQALADRGGCLCM